MVDFDLICGDAIKELQKMEELKENDRHHFEIFKKTGQGTELYKLFYGDKMKVRDGIVGLTVGDALGVPVEFRPGKYLRENPVTGMMGHGTYDMPRGTWSDDTSLTLATMQSIVNKKAIDLEDIINEFSLYVSESKYCQYEVFDYGHTTIQAIRKFDSGYPVSQCGGRGDRDNGNGSLMRILPLAFISGITYDDIENVSSLTHAHMKSRIACVLYVEIAKSMLERDLEISEHIKNSCEKIKKHYEDSDYLMDFKSILEMDFNVDEGRSYVIKTLEAVLYCLLETGSYKEAVLKAVNLGRDTDTVAAITGGLAGIYYGYDDIPAEWIGDIPQIDYVFGFCGDYEKFCMEK